MSVTDVTAHRITNQLYEGLLKFNQADLSIVPALAESYEVNDSATLFTFHLRKGVKFHNDPCFPNGKGREVTAKDFQFCFNKLCSTDPDNQMFWMFKDRVVGANDYYESTKEGNTPLADGVSGIRVKDDYTLEIELEYPFAGFVNILGQSGCWVFPQEAEEKYGVDMRIHPVGTGPFVVKRLKENDGIILVRNEGYWRKDEYGNQLPYLDGIRFSFVNEKKTELLDFRKGKLDMIFTLPLELVDEVMGELDDARKHGNLNFEVQNIPALTVQYYGFQHKSELFSDKRVRQAFNYAIDRKKILDYTLRGEGQAGSFGIVPPAFKKYNYDSLRGYRFNPEKAQALLAEAGYPKGAGFPKLSLDLNRGGSNNIIVAEAIQKMLKENLGVQIDLTELSTAQHFDRAETGKSLFWKDQWLADYPDPETFLNLLYGKHVPASLEEKSYINSVRYESSRFDSIFQLAIRETDHTKRYELYQMADQIAIDDAAIMPIYYGEFTRLLHKHVRNFPQNGMEYRDLSEVYFQMDEYEQLASKR